MADFSHLKKLAALTVPYDLEEVAPGAKLLVSHATSRNKGYAAEVAADRIAHPEPAKDSHDAVRDAWLAAERLRDAGRFGRHVVKDWNAAIVDAAGAAVPFTTDHAVELLEALARHAPDVLDGLRVFCKFSTEINPARHVETLAKN